MEYDLELALFYSFYKKINRNNIVRTSFEQKDVVLTFNRHVIFFILSCHNQFGVIQLCVKIEKKSEKIMYLGSDFQIHVQNQISYI